MRDVFGRPVRRPHFLEVIELAHLGPKHVHNDVAGVDQNPVAGFLALNAHAAETLFFEFALELVGDRANMPI